MTDDRGRRHPSAAWWYAGITTAIAATVMALEALSLARFGERASVSTVVVIAATALAVGLYRIHPGVGLALVWVIGVWHAITGEEVLAGQLAVGVLAYGIGRYGSRVVLASGVISIVVAVPLGVFLIVSGYAQDSQASLNLSVWLENAVVIGGLGGLTWTALPALSLPLVVPVLVGISLRMWDRSRQSVAAMEDAQNKQAEALARERQAQELAELREGQARLARDVHDVVGHSLTVILAQAQSAQYLDRELKPEVARALGSISDTARSSLADVRSILTATQERGDDSTSASIVPPDFQRLLDDVRAAGTPLHVENLGQSRPLPPDQAVTLYRVLQEMLTNVLKHGITGHEVNVTFDWRAGLVVRVSNEAPEESVPEPGDHRGLAGMLDRMVAVGGTLTTARSGSTFAAEATFPHAGESAPLPPVAAGGETP